MEHELQATQTLTAIEMDIGGVLKFRRRDGTVAKIELLDTDARLLYTSLDSRKLPLSEVIGAKTVYEFTITLRINGEVHALRREIPTQRTFYEPWEIAGLRIWPDAVDKIFEFLIETHGSCKPGKDARLAIQDAQTRICPDRVLPFLPLPDRLNVLHCYCGEDCWMGPFCGGSAHGGLDINHPAGTPIYAPFDLDDQYFFETVAGGANNNRWRAHRRWEDGSEWVVQCHHMTRLTVAEHTPVKAGQQVADGGGVLNGFHEHSHFVFKVKREEETILLDPWILFWQMYRDQDDTTAANDHKRH